MTQRELLAELKALVASGRVNHDTGVIFAGDADRCFEIGIEPATVELLLGELETDLEAYAEEGYVIDAEDANGEPEEHTVTGVVVCDGFINLETKVSTAVLHLPTPPAVESFTRTTHELSYSLAHALARWASEQIDPLEQSHAAILDALQDVRNELAEIGELKNMIEEL